ncbi:MAG: ATP cone domain-containing protein [Candidatus Micrarchaeia archaeon]
MIKVQKKNGTIERFAREKIVVALLKNGNKLTDARKIARDVERAFKGKTTVTVEEIRKEILSRLEKINKELYEKWLSYESNKKQ